MDFERIRTMLNETKMTQTARRELHREISRLERERFEELPLIAQMETGRGEIKTGIADFRFLVLPNGELSIRTLNGVIAVAPSASNSIIISRR